MTEPGTAPLILVADDDPRMRRLISEVLTLDGFRVSAVPDGEQAIGFVQEQNADLLVLDLIMPYFSGMEVLRRLRKFGFALPVLVLTGVDAELDKVRALEIGADDYLTKPFGQRELVARVKALLRRSRGAVLAASAEGPPAIQAGTLTLVPELRTLLVDGHAVVLTKTEYQLLLVLIRQPDRIFTPPELLGRVWGAGYAEATQVLRTAILRLRRKIEPDPKQPRYIRTRGGGRGLVGYFLSTETADPANDSAPSA